MIVDITCVVDDKDVLSLSSGRPRAGVRARQARGVPRARQATAASGCRRTRSSIRRTYTLQRHRAARARPPGAAPAARDADRRRAADHAAAADRRGVRRDVRGGGATSVPRTSKQGSRRASRRSTCPRRRAAASRWKRRRDSSGRAPARASRSARPRRRAALPLGRASSPRMRAWGSSATGGSSTCASRRASPASRARRRSRPTPRDPNPDNVTLITLPAHRPRGAVVGVVHRARRRARRRRRAAARARGAAAAGSQRASRGRSRRPSPETLAFLADTLRGQPARRAAGDREARAAAARGHARPRGRRGGRRRRRPLRRLRGVRGVARRRRGARALRVLRRWYAPRAKARSSPIWSLGEDLHAHRRDPVDGARGHAARQRAAQRARVGQAPAGDGKGRAARVRATTLVRFLVALSRIDAMSKGMASGDAWDEITALALAIAGRPARPLATTA